MTRNVRHVRIGALVTLLGAIMISGLAAAPLKAQSGNPLDLLLTAVTSLQNSVNAIQQRLNVVVAPAQANVRITPVLLASSHDVGCSAVNVSTGTRTVRIENHAGAQPFIQTPTLTPGSISTPFVLDTGGAVYCKFIVMDGTRTDIRGAIIVKSNGSIEPGVALAAE